MPGQATDTRTTYGSFLRGVVVQPRVAEAQTNYRYLHVRTVDSEAGYAERVSYQPFDGYTGLKALPDDLRYGDFVEVKVFTRARVGGKKGAFLACDLMAIEVLIPAPSSAPLVAPQAGA